ncbi:MAG: hypothetical protein IJ220_01030 [Clostridia bacterium]|nr:hypothetical protein [Clostridia bacterium]
MAIVFFFETLLLGSIFFFTFFKVEKDWNAITRIVLSCDTLLMCFFVIGVMPTIGSILFQLYCMAVSGLALGLSIAQLTGALVPFTESRHFDFRMPDGSMIPKIED